MTTLIKTLTPAQATVVKDTHRFRVINAGRRFGKTVLASWEMFACATHKKDQKIAYIAPTYRQARDIAWVELIKVCQNLIDGAPNEQRLEIPIKTIDGGQSIITLKGWESVDSLRGQSFDLLVCDEVAMFKNFWEGWHEVLRPTLTDRKGSVMFISTPKGFNHFYDLFNLESKDEDYKSFHYTSKDNPNLPQDEVEKARKEMTEDRYAQEYLADFRKQEGLVYKEFIRDKHIYNDNRRINAKEILAGVDFGYTHPAVALTVLKDGDGNYFVSSEWYQRGKTEAEIAEQVSAVNYNRVYPDPESPSAIEELKRRGVNVRDVIKGKDSVMSGIQRVRELFKANKLFIHEDCINLIYELETYSFEERKHPMKGADNIEIDTTEKPLKENDDCCDALRYCLVMDSLLGKTENKYKRYVPSV